MKISDRSSAAITASVGTQAHGLSGVFGEQGRELRRAFDEFPVHVVLVGR